jgi:hypothetical protein
MATKSEQGQYIVQKYRRAGNKWPATTREIATWAIDARLWAPQPSAVIGQCAEELSRALRDEYVTDPQGRRIRTKHAATYTTDEGEQFVLWDDIRTAPPAHLSRAFQQRRQQILGDCKQLKSDVDSFNQNRQPSEPIQIVFDFTLDLEEAAYLKRSA